MNDKLITVDEVRRFSDIVSGIMEDTRMGMRWFTRLTNGFSKKIENLECAVALHFMHYNFGRIHKTLRGTPVMEAGVSDHVLSLEEIASLTS